MITRRLVVPLSLVAALAVMPVGSQATHGFLDTCFDQDADAVYPTPPMDDIAPGITGQYALPATPPKALVALAHGYGHRSDSWVEHMKRLADAGAIAFAMDYRLQGPAPENRGWRVQEGAEDIVAAAQSILSECPIDTVIIYGVSMGGNASGLAVAAKAQKPLGGLPLFDYWVAGEPAANMIETYLEATTVGLVNEFAANAAADIEEASGGPIEIYWEEYLRRTVVARIADIAASGIKGVAVVHGFDDGLVPYNQGRELATLLRLSGIPTDFFNAARRELDGTECGTDNTTLTENALGPIVSGATGECYTEPLAGHGTESSQTNIVIQTGLDVVFDLIAGTYAPADHEFVVDGEAGVVPLI